MAAAVAAGQFVLTYKGIDITADVSSMVLSLVYIDQLTAAAGEIEVELEDSQKLWQGPWYPQQGDEVNLLMGYAQQPLLPCGDFQVDELELAGPPDVFWLRGLAAWITPAMRTANNVAYENQSLLQIAGVIAQKYGLTLVSAAGAPDPLFARVTQNSETDLGFLKRIARAHGYDFTVRGTQLVFYAIAALEGVAPVLALERSDVMRFRFRDKTHEVYQGALVSYQDPATKQLVAQNVASAAPLPAPGDTLKQVLRCENGQQALLKAQSALHAANMVQTTMELVTEGNTTLAAGSNLTITGFGMNDGTYLIESARHRFTRDEGYLTSVVARQLSAGQ